MKKILDRLQELALIKPKPRREGPAYGDILVRSLAAGIDLWLLYLLFAPIFAHLTQAIYARVDAELLAQASQVQSLGEAVQLFRHTALGTAWVINWLMQLVLLASAVLAILLRWGTTPGKWIFGLKIVQRGSFEKPRSWQYVVRVLGHVLSVPPLMLGVVWGSFNHEHRTWHDMLAGTVVLQTRPAEWYWKKIKAYYAQWRGKKAPTPAANDQPPSAD